MARPFELQSRDEEILASIIDGTEYDEEAQSRIEYLLLELKSVIEAGGSSSDYAVDIDFSMNSQTFVVTAQLKNKDGDLIGTPKSVDIPLESTVVNGSYDNVTKALALTLVSGQSINIPIGAIVSGLLPDNGNYTEFANGQRLYVSSTQPTGTIAEGSVGIGW